ncbi:type IX secretion system membrane protein PorP/SprF [soil metagenome]
MKKHIYISIVGTLLSLAGFAQQDPSFSQYFFNPMYVNPGYAGSRDVLSGTLVHRSQWVGMEGAPESQSLNIHSALPYTKIGLGLQINNDKAGPMKNTGIGLIFAYHLHLGREARLAFGVQGSVSNLRIDYGKINIDDNTDQAFVNNTSSSWVPEAGAGLYFYKNRFYAGLSARNLIQSRFKLQDPNIENSAKFFRHYYFTAGVVKDLSENFAIRPSILVKYVQAAPVVFDLNASVIFKQQLFLGAGFRTGKRIDIKGLDNMLVASIEYDFKNRLRFGYSYDFYLSRTGNYNSGTHEIMIGWDLNFAKTKMTSPRFF